MFNLVYISINSLPLRLFLSYYLLLSASHSLYLTSNSYISTFETSTFYSTLSALPLLIFPLPFHVGEQYLHSRG
jgi:hypothetical protein